MLVLGGELGIVVLFVRGIWGSLVVEVGEHRVLQQAWRSREGRRGYTRSIEFAVVWGGWQGVRLEGDGMIVVLSRIVRLPSKVIELRPVSP